MLAACSSLAHFFEAGGKRGHGGWVLVSTWRRTGWRTRVQSPFHLQKTVSCLLIQAAVGLDHIQVLR